MVHDPSRLLSVGCVCFLLVLAGCSAVPGASPAPTDQSPTGTTTASPTPLSDTHTATPETETTAPGGLLIVDVVANRSTVNDSTVVAYNGTIVGQSPMLDDAITAAIAANATRTEDLSSRELDRVEAVAGDYGVPTGEFVVAKNGTLVRVSLGYEA
jgi:sulfur carrier protein ThiS